MGWSIHQNLNPLEPQDVALFGNRVFAGEIKDCEMKFLKSEQALNEWCPYAEMSTDTQGWQEDGGRHWEDAPVSQGMLRIAGNYQELGERHGMVPPLEPT